MPLNRFVTFVKPFINAGAGLLAAWMVAKVNVVGIDGLNEANLQTYLTGAGVWLFTQAGAQQGDARWLKGHHIELETAGWERTSQGLEEDMQ